MGFFGPQTAPSGTVLPRSTQNLGSMNTNSKPVSLSAGTSSWALSRWLAGAVALCLVTGTLSAWGATKTWSGDGTTGDWNDAGNWIVGGDGGTVPINGDDLVFPTSGNRKTTCNNNLLTSLGNVTIEGGGYTISGNGLTLNGDISNNGASTWAINLSISSGADIDNINVRQIESIGGLSGGLLTVSGDIAMTGFASVSLKANHTTGNDGIITVSGIISGDNADVVAVSKSGSGAGTVTLTGVNTYAGKTSINSGYLVVTADNNLGTLPESTVADQIQLNGGYLRTASTFTLDPLRGVRIMAGGLTTGFWVDSGAVLTYGGVISAQNALTTYKLTLDGAGTVALSGNNTYRGDTLVIIKVARALHNNAFGYPNNSIIGVNATSKVELYGGITIARPINLDFATLVSTSGNNTCSTSIEILTSTSGKSVIRAESGAVLTVPGAVVVDTGGSGSYENLYVEGDGDITISGGITANSSTVGHADIYKDGNGTLDISGVNNAYTGRTFIDSGTLVIDRDQSLGSTPGGLKSDYITIKGILSVNGSFKMDQRRGIVLGTSSSSDGGTINVNGSFTLVYGGSTYLGVIADNGSGAKTLTKTGTGKLHLQRANTYTGKTIINGGTILAGSEDLLGAPASYADDNLTLNGGTIFATNTFNIANANRGVTLGSGGGTFIVTNSSTLLIDKVIAGTGNLTKSGAGSGNLALSKANTYTGKTTVSSGAIMLGIEESLGIPSASAADSLTLNGGTLYATNDFTIDDANRGITLGASGGTISVDSGKTLQVSKVIAGTGALTKNLTGILNLTSGTTCTYSGTTTVSAGTLLVNGSTHSSSAVTVGSSGTIGGGGHAYGTVALSGILSPGNSPGTLYTGNETWNSGASYTWQVTETATNGTPGSNWDLLNVNGTLTVNATSGSKFTINVVGSPTDFDNTQIYLWKIATTSGGVSSFATNKFAINASGFTPTLAANNGFSVRLIGNDVYLEYTHVTANNFTIGRAYGTYLRIPVATLIDHVTGGVAPLTVTGVSGNSAATLSGNYIMFAPSAQIESSFTYSVADASATPLTSSALCTVSVTNAVSGAKTITSSGNSVTITFAGYPGYNYIVERTSNLQGSWTVVDTRAAPAGGVWTITETPPYSPAYYRSRQNN